MKTIYPDNTFSTVAYDELGRTISKTDQAGKTTQSAYDKLGRLVQVMDALSQETTYSYNEVGQQLTQTDANNHTTRYEYDKLGRRVKRTLPMGQTETYSYELGGNLQSRTDFNGKMTVYSYDVMRQLLSKTPDPSLNQPAVSYSYTVTGQRQTMTDASGTTTYTYDSRNRLQTKATPAGTLTYTYDDVGNLKSTRSSNTNGVSVDYAYDELNRLSAVTDNRLPVGAQQTSYSYDSVGNLQGYVYPNGVSTSYAYNALNRLTTLTIGNSTANLASYSYTLGAAGNREAVTEADGRSVTYTYDALYRLTGEAITNAPTVSNNGAIEYSYDAVGNRLSRTSTLSAIPNQTATYDANDRLTADGFDNNGNTIVSNGTTYSFDWENHLSAVNGGSISYVYDGDGNRVAKSVGGITIKYLVDTNNLTGYAQVVEELVNGAVTRSYTYGHDLISENQLVSNQWQVNFYGYDGHGSVRLLTDTQGAVTDRYDYDAFGNLISQTGSTPNDYLYAGERYDINVGFYYLRARYMNPSNGRFQTPDSFEGHSADPLTLHKYLYTGADPINKIDPSGKVTLAEVVITLPTSQIINALAVLSLVAVCAIQYANSPPGGYDFGDSPIPPSPCVKTKPQKPNKIFYRGTTYYDALEIVQNQSIDRLGLNTGYDLGPGLYLTKDIPSARYYAEINSDGGRRAGGGAVIKAEIPDRNWSALLMWGAIEDAPTTQLPFRQSFVPAPYVSYFNRYARFSLELSFP